MKDFIARIGGRFWASVTALSVIITVAGGLGLPFVIDTSNQWIVFILCSVSFIIGAFNGWKQRGFSNKHDIEYAEALERERMEIARRNDAEIARITAEKELEIDRRRREERAKAEQEAEEKEKRSAQDLIARMEESMERLTPSQKELVGDALRNGGACTTEKKNTDSALLKSIGVFDELGVTDATRTHWKLSDSAMTVLSRNQPFESSCELASIRAEEASIKESFEHASYLQKLLMMFCYRNDTAEVSRDLFNRIYGKAYFRYINVGDDSIAIYLTDEIREMIDRNPCVLEFCASEGDVDQWIKDEVNRQDRYYW